MAGFGVRKDVRRCLQGCCRIVDGQSVTLEEYERAVFGPSGKMPAVPLVGTNIAAEALIACRNLTGFSKDVENEAGFYLGHLTLRLFGQPVPLCGMPILFDLTIGERREARPEDVARWQEIWNRLAKEEASRKSKQ